MSFRHPNQNIPQERRKKEFFVDNYYQRPYLDGYSSPASSPPRSSSPPKTPYTSRGYAHVRSSPEMSSDGGLNYAWGHSNSTWKTSSMLSYPRPPSSVSSAPTSEFDPFESSHDSESDVRLAQASDDEDDDLEEMFGLRSRTTYFSTSSERGLWKTDPIPFKKTSPIRLQTRKSVPSLSRIPTPTLLATRTVSEPATSTWTQSTSFLGGEELAASSGDVAPDTSQVLVIPSEPAAEVEITSPQTIPSLASDRGSSEDVDVELEVEDPGIPSSPLPPSSPPMSPLSRSVSIFSRSSSPLSALPDERSSSPLSELPDDYDDDEHDFQDMQEDLTSEQIAIVDSEPVASLRPEIAPDADSDPSNSRDTAHSTLPQVPFKPQSSPESVSTSSSAASVADGPNLEILPAPTLDPVPSPSAKKLFHLNDVDVQVTCSLTVPSPSSTHHASDSGPSNNTLSISLPVNSTLQASVFGSPVIDTVVHVDDLRASEDKDGEGARAKKGVDDVVDDVIKAEPQLDRVDDIEVDAERMDVDGVEEKVASMMEVVEGKVLVMRASSSVTASCLSRSSSPVESAAKVKRNSKSASGPAKKRRKVDMSDDVSMSRTPDVEDSEEPEQDRNSEVAPPKRRRRKGEGDPTSESTTKRSRKRARASTPVDDNHDKDNFDEPLDDEAKVLHINVCGLVIETMATTRASALPASSIYKLVMLSQPSLKEQRTCAEWTRVIERVLRDGEKGRGCGVFAKVDSSFQDAGESSRGRGGRTKGKGKESKVEAQWFYVPERDEDQERATLMRGMMPRPAKRMETMKYKQYYWTPVDKISWDEDE